MSSMATERPRIVIRPAHASALPQRLPACMGGWCTQRDRCALHVTQPRTWVSERLCARGYDRPVRMEAAA
jgi:hypothetical protein